MVSATCSATGSPTSCSSTNGGIGSPSADSALSASGIGVPSSTAALTSPRKRVSSRFTTNAGASFTSTQDFFSVLPTANAVASDASSVRSARMISSSGSTATGLKKWNPTTRSGCSRSAAISVTDSDDVLVARIASGRTIFSRSAKIVFFSCSSSNTASITKSASANTGLVDRPGDQRLQLVCLVRRRSGPSPSSLSISPCTYPTPRSTRSWSRSVSTTGTSSRRANSRASWPAIRPAPTTPTFDDRPGQRLVRRAGRALGPLVHQVERVEAAAQLLAHDQVGERLVLGREPAVAVVVLRRRDQVQRPVRRRRGTAHLDVGEALAPGDRRVPGVTAVDLRPLDRDLTGQDLRRPRSATARGSPPTPAVRRRCRASPPPAR